jgi:hypothetical protein
MERPKVFVVQEVFRKNDNGLVPAFDLTPAAAFGEIRTIMPSGWNGIGTSEAEHIMQQKLKDFKQADYLLPLGDPVLIMLAGMVAGMKTAGYVQVLKWDRKTKAYIPVIIDIFDF